MHAVMTINKPDEIEATVQITMKVKEWKALQAELGEAWPACDLHRVITELLAKAGSTFWANAK